MSTIQERAAEAQAKMQAQNPSTTPGKPAAERKRIPMTLPTLKLEVPAIPGYHLHWFRGSQARLQQAMNAGYEFVSAEEVQINNVALGGDATKDGNSDMGSRVSISSGNDMDASGQPARLYLMKQKMEYYLEDQKLLEGRNDSVAAALTASFRQGTVGAGQQGETGEDVAHRYVNKTVTKVPDMFRKKPVRG